MCFSGSRPQVSSLTFAPPPLHPYLTLQSHPPWAFAVPSAGTPASVYLLLPPGSHRPPPVQDWVIGSHGPLLAFRVLRSSPQLAGKLQEDREESVLLTPSTVAGAELGT